MYWMLSILMAVLNDTSNNHIKSPFGLGRCASRRAPYVNRWTPNHHTLAGITPYVEAK